MRPKFAAVVLGILALKCLTVAWAAPADNETVPLTMMAEVDLRGAVHFLAEQVGLNCILDTCIPGSYYGVGRGMRAPEVSVRFENKTSEYVFYFVLRKYQLTVVTNPATTVARIVPAGHWVKPVPVTPSLSDTNGLLTKMNLNGTLAEVIETAAKAANLKAVFDSQFSSSEYVQRATLDSFHWNKITPRQALAALLDNFDLVMKEEAATNVVQISLKQPEELDPHRRPRSKKPANRK